MLQQVCGVEEYGVSSLAVHPTSSPILLATSLEGYAKLFDTRQTFPAAGGSSEVARLVGHTEGVNNALFLEDNVVVTASDDRSLGCWDLRSPAAPLQVVKGFREGVNRCCLGPAGSQTLVSACDDGYVYVHSFAGGDWSLVDTFWASPAPLNDIAVLPGSAAGNIVTASDDSAVRVWNRDVKPDQMPDDRLINAHEEFDEGVNHLMLYADETFGTAAAAAVTGVGGESGAAGEGEEDEGDAAAPGPPPPPPPAAPTGLWLYVAVNQHIFATTIDPVTGALGVHSQAFGGHTDYVRGIEIVAPNTLLSVADDATAIVWSTETCQPLAKRKLHETMIMALAVRKSPEGSCDAFFSGCEDGSIRLWSLPLMGDA